MARLSLCIFLAAFWANSTLGAILLNAGSGPVKVENIDYFEDKDGQLTFDQVKQVAFKTSSATPNFGYTGSAYWFRIEVENSSGAGYNYLLEVAYPVLDRVDFYYHDSGQKLVKKFTGDHYPFKQRDIEYANFVFEFYLEKQVRTTLYLRVETTSSLQVPVTIYPAAAFHESKSAYELMFGIYYGIILLMIVYNLFVFAYEKDMSQVYYVLFLLGFGLFQFSINGLAFQYLWPGWPGWSNLSLPFFIAVGATAGCQFSRLVLNTKVDDRYLDLAFLSAIAVGSVAGLLSLLLPYKMSILMILAVTALQMILMYVAGIIRLRQKYNPARLFTTAWSILLAGIAIYMLKTVNVLPTSFFTEYAVQIGSVLQITLLSLALLDRINVIKREREDAKLETVETKLTMMESFSRFIPDQFLQMLDKASALEVAIGDAVEKETTVLFSDIRRFTRLSENMNVEQNFRFLNAYLSRMAPNIHRCNGFIDKFIGDAIMAIFPERADDALAATIAMHKELQVYNQHRANSGYEPLEVGYGLNHGKLMLGTVGHASRLDTTVVGDTVNIAARIESLTKIFKVPILLSDYVFRNLEEPEKFHLREVESVRLRGKKRPIVLFEVFDIDSEDVIKLKEESRSTLMAGLTLYKSGDFDLAIDRFEQCAAINPHDSIPKIYLKRCRHLLENPPGPNWSGVARVRG